MNIKISKIGISQESDHALDQMLSKVNEGFTGGRVTKSDLASWIILHFEGHFLENNLEKIRKDHFDQVAYLESVVREMKKARKSGTETLDLTSLLVPVTASIKNAQKKKSTGEDKDQ